MTKTAMDMQQLLVYEKRFVSEGKKIIAGMDEVGRGPLAGPVVVACVVMPIEEDKIIQGVTDSKKLSEKRREELYEKIISTATQCVVCQADNVRIDEINILNATKECMKNCIEGLTDCNMVLVDAVKLTDTKFDTFPIIKGDAKSYCIAAASIVAKVTRDRLMKEYDVVYPRYGFKDNKGYGTAAHIAALKEYGFCEIHRKTFIKNFFS